MWTQQQAINLCREVENVCPRFGCHVALTGGLLYKDGKRKDCDLLFYRVRQVKKIDTEQLWAALSAIGLVADVDRFGWCVKGTYDGKPVDIFFPEEIRGGQGYGECDECGCVPEECECL
jgi:hypothetical protein